MPPHGGAPRPDDDASVGIVRRILVPYHHAEPLPALGDAFAADDAVVVSKGPPGMMLARLYAQVARRVAAADGPVVVASGDCTTALGTVAGLQARGLSPGAIWLDAHADFHTPRTTISGYFGGMALAMLTGRAGASLASAAGLRPLADESCALVGARDLDPAEIAALAASRVRQIALDELAQAALPPPPWYVHLDVDVLDPDGLPALRFPAPGGPSPETLAAALRALAARGTIAALGLACTFTAKALTAPDPLERIRPLVAAALGAGGGEAAARGPERE